jgi:acyl-CoA thioesterase
MQAIRQYFAEDQFAARCNIRLALVEEGRAVAAMSIEPWHLNAYGTVQGGAIFTLADYAFAAASNSHGSVAVGISVSIHYIKAAKSGSLRAEAKEAARNAKLGTYLVEVRDDAGDLVATFQGMVYRKSEAIRPPQAPQD